MKTATCHCGARWVQSGNRTGHCASCHRTFSGVSAFDRHQTIVDGKSACLDPATRRGGDGVSPMFMSYLDRLGAQVWRRADTPVTATSDAA